MGAHVCKDDQIVERFAVDRASLKARGWTAFRPPGAGEPGFTECLLQLARELGTPTPTRSGSGLCDKLSPTEADEAQPSSLSRLHAFGEFPLHTDTSHWLTPCRYIILACASPGIANRPTFLMDTRQTPLSDRQKSLLHSTPLRVMNGKNSFYSTVISKSRPFVRLDPGCMTATTPESMEALGVFSRHNWPNHIEEIHWSAGAVLVVDNWRVLHGRAKSDIPDPDRLLLRISIR
jgi:hypothetical protein